MTPLEVSQLQRRARSNGWHISNPLAIELLQPVGARLGNSGLIRTGTPSTHREIGGIAHCNLWLPENKHAKLGKMQTPKTILFVLGMWAPKHQSVTPRSPSPTRPDGPPFVLNKSPLMLWDSIVALSAPKHQAALQRFCSLKSMRSHLHHLPTLIIAHHASAACQHWAGPPPPEQLTRGALHRDTTYLRTVFQKINK